MGGEGRREGAVTGRVAEAAAGSFESRRDAINKTIRGMCREDEYRYIVALFQSPDQVVVSDGSALTRYDYALQYVVAPFRHLPSPDTCDGFLVTRNHNIWMTIR